MVNADYSTEVPHIYAVGDVIGFPALAATSMDQGRLAASYAFSEAARELQALQPIGIYTIPEISYCGKVEAELTNESVPFEVGISRYRELARGQITGDSYGMLKLIVHSETREISACTCSAPTRPRSSTSARRSWAAAARSTTWSTRCSTTRRCPRPTRSPLWTSRTSCARLLGSPTK